jgi:glucose-6-phosphate 1-dehydrogenase
MMHWKFLLFGVTGDLSKKKVLPSLARFAENHKEEISLELIGYSRSKPDLKEITELLNNSTLSGKHNLANITDIQGEYSDFSRLDVVFNSLKENERLVLYLAIPPHLFSVILRNLRQYADKNIDIVIEKPFGYDKNQALEIFEVLEKSGLNDKTHFFDHALFKSPLILEVNEYRAVKDLLSETIKSLQFTWLEALDVKGRGGYYDENGAIKDMFPSHMYAILDYTLSVFNLKKGNISELFQIKGVEKGQYEEYRNDIAVNDSETETYFKINAYINLKGIDTAIVVESGKKMKEKQTEVIFSLENGDYIIWNLGHPHNKFYLEISKSGLVQTFDLSMRSRPEHINMFDDLLKGKYNRFFTKEMVIDGWNLYDKVVEFIKKDNIKTKRYKSHTWPVEYLD